MNFSLETIQWLETNSAFKPFPGGINDALGSMMIHSMKQGMEAEVVKLSQSDHSYVLKIWNRHSRPDVGFQFQLLQALTKRKLAVSVPLGWGVNSDEHHVLLTVFGGTPVSALNAQEMRKLAQILAHINRISQEELSELALPQNEFISYFYPGIEEHPDLQQTLSQLVDQAHLRQDRLIHGDYHLENILEDGNTFTIIDWTNGQLGDPRYDLAWSLLLLRVFASERLATVFGNAYLKEHPMTQEELDCFEAIACIRGVLLYREGNMAIEKNVLKKLRGIIKRNPQLAGMDSLVQA
ncbi:phosphotransferase enzyme family protein [Paenibacillus sp. GCM10012307]|uniref:Aminoglycoside phosphotransferase family protein n=1 Tax=Paenibacillus roseus TaxID=2798579 RepID=A0A934J3Z6_9BACL|nr:aminoglycoside phosphotransferase family protein [Paenibacillus roseus]MBJ6361219.1 aminoglycoside phosphotransferase family protein [Paenibacillus roseus]